MTAMRIGRRTAGLEMEDCLPLVKFYEEASVSGYVECSCA